MHAVLSIY